MTQNLSLELEANKTYVGVVNATGVEITFTTGNACSTNSSCPINGNTTYDSTMDNWYYSWYAATANSGTSSMTSGDATLSICPAGWRLPSNYTVNTSKSYGSITNVYSMTSNGENNHGDYVTQLESFPLNFRRTEDTNNGVVEDSSDVGGAGRYASSTAYNSARYNQFLYYRATTYPQDNIPKYYGTSVRCVAL